MFIIVVGLIVVVLIVVVLIVVVLIVNLRDNLGRESKLAPAQPAKPAQPALAQITSNIRYKICPERVVQFYSPALHLLQKQNGQSADKAFPCIIWISL